MNKIIYIRVDGSEQTGLGHLSRCIAMAQILTDKFEVVFVSRILPDRFSNRNVNQVIRISKEEHFFKLLNKESFVVVDGYIFDSSYCGDLKKYGGIICSIQDVQHFSSNVDLVINHLPGSSIYYREVNLLSGPEYAILRKEFLSPPVNKSSPDNVFISLGGTDTSDEVNKIVDLLKKIGFKGLINVLTTDKNKKQINGEKCIVHTNQSENEVIELIDKSSLCFITSGMILYEVLARNRNAIVGALNKGQHEVGQKFQDLKLTEYVGLWNDIDLKKFSKALRLENINMDTIKRVFDGQSGNRILNKILELV